MEQKKCTVALLKLKVHSLVEYVDEKDVVRPGGDVDFSSAAAAETQRAAGQRRQITGRVPGGRVQRAVD
jgi:hypothetical protein